MSEILFLLPGILITTAVANFVFARRIVRHWTMTQRREQILLEFFVALNESFATAIDTGDQPSVRETAELMNVCAVRLSDELHNQERALSTWRSAFWPRVPEVGEEWPDFQPSDLGLPDA